MQRSHTLMLTLALIAGSVCAVMLNGIIPIHIQAQQAKEERKPTELKWHYCAISDVAVLGRGGKSIASASICYFHGSGCQQIVVEATVDGDNFAEATSAALAKALAQLGDEGWEMIGEATQFGSYKDGVDPKALYFRRSQS